MSFIDKLNKIAKTAADKTSELMESSKLNSRISQEQRNIQVQKQKIGDYFWNRFEEGEPWPTELEEQCAAIKASIGVIADTQAELSVLKERQNQPAEFTEPQQLTEEQVQEQQPVFGEQISPETRPGVVFCTNCGIRNSSENNFCRECGAKLAN